MTDLFTLSSGASVVATESVELGGSFDNRHVPEDTKLNVVITGIVINPRKEGAGYVQEENIGFDLLVTEEGEYKDFEQHQKLHVNDVTPVKDRNLLNEGILTKADKAKKTLMTYDIISGSKLSQAAQQGQDPYDAGTLNRCFNGMELTATFGLISNDRMSKNDATGRYDVPVYEDDGVTPVVDYTNWIKGIEPKTLGARVPDAVVTQEAQNQPNAPVVDPVPMQTAQPTAQPTAQAQKPATHNRISQDDLPF